MNFDPFMRLPGDLLNLLGKVLAATPALGEIIGNFFPTTNLDKDGTEVEVLIEVRKCVGDFITFNQGFYQEIRTLTELIVNYWKRPKPKRPLNIFLLAPPGSGKSFLVKQIAAELRDEYDAEALEYHVAAMKSVSDLHSVFRLVHASLAEGNRPVLLLDEVDAKVGDEYLFKHLLAPMADGKYFSENRSYFLGKVVLLFAASKELVPFTIQDLQGQSFIAWRSRLVELLRNYGTSKDSEARDSDQQNGEVPMEKFADFRDRVDWVVCVPPSKLDFEDTDPSIYLRAGLKSSELAQLKKTGVEIESLIMSYFVVKSHFKDVKQLDLDAAAVIGSLLQESDSKRDADTLVFLSSNPSSKKFDFDLLPSSMLPQEGLQSILERRKSDPSRTYMRVELVE